MKHTFVAGVALCLTNMATAQEIQPGPATREETQRLQQLEAQVEKLQTQLDALERTREEEELEKLRLAADTEAAAEPEERLEDKTFLVASRSLQMLNPEISVSGDFVAQLVTDPRFRFYLDQDDRSALPLLRALGLHIQSSLDPFSFTKAAIGWGPDRGAMVEELYITWTGLIPRATVTVGRFRQLLGVVNRWHEHDLDQVDHPLALRALFGDEGLAQSGASLGWLLPAFTPLTQELTLQLTNASNEAVFAGEFFSVPAGLAHFKNYVDLSESLYVELGLTAAAGPNNRRAELIGGSLVDEPWRTSAVGGVDLTVLWEPLQQARYRSVTWRSEGYWVSQEQSSGWTHGWGAYSYVNAKLGAMWYLGLRADVVQPVADLRNQLRWAVTPYATLWQSEFVYFRLQASHGLNLASQQETRVMLQVDWAAGPHKHEKY